ncbi:hypothetical protein [Roseimicrobium gellanilyticum]|nr:hypothetical protein [Roseimicrobium gellanilyticum]
MPCAVAMTVVGCTTPKFTDYERLQLPSKAGSEKQSVVFSNFSANPLVQNGQAYEQVRLKLPEGVKTMTVPTGTVVAPSERDEVVIYLKKSLGWMGHPDGPVSILTEKKGMGAGVLVHRTTLRFTLFGGSSSFEGGSSVSAVVLVPPSVRVKTYEKRPFDDEAEYQAQGWYTLSTVPDADKTFLKYTRKP